MSEYPTVSRLAEEAYGVFDTATSRAKEIFQPTVRLGVTGLSRAGKTVFITSLIHNLIHGKKLPFFNAKYSGRISRVY
ncbi:MAG: YcjX family protein, partial [Lentilitoribacter sp.]